MLDLLSARHWARQLHAQAISPGSIVVDATMGGGGDTLDMCRMVGEGGRVYAFDIQPDAVERTRARLEAEGLLGRAALICDGHQNMEKYLSAPVDAVLFNLGWLPGGDKSVTTLTETTLQAVDAALRLLKPGGLLTICVYPGHGEGSREKRALLKWAEELDGHAYQAMTRMYLNQPENTPLLIAVQKLNHQGR